MSTMRAHVRTGDEGKLLRYSVVKEKRKYKPGIFRKLLDLILIVIFMAIGNLLVLIKGDMS